jgi:hypothetical protein
VAGEVLGEIWVVTGGPVVELRVFVRGVAGYRFKAGASPQRVIAEGVPLASLVIQNVDAANDVEIGNDRSLSYGDGLKIPGNATLANGTVSAGASAGGVAPVDSAHVFNSANQNIPNAVQTTLAFDSERYKTTAGMHDNVVNNSRITIQKAGKYHVGATIQWGAAAGVNRGLFILQNGVQVAADGMPNPGAANFVFQNVGVDIQCAVGDVLIVQAYQDSGAGLVVVAAGNYSPDFWAHQFPAL